MRRRGGGHRCRDGRLECARRPSVHESCDREWRYIERARDGHAGDARAQARRRSYRDAGLVFDGTGRDRAGGRVDTIFGPVCGGQGHEHERRQRARRGQETELRLLTRR